MIKFSKIAYLLAVLILFTSCSARTNYVIDEVFSFIALIFVLIVGGIFVYGWITESKGSSSESDEIINKFGCTGLVIFILAILVLLFKCS